MFKSIKFKNFKKHKDLKITLTNFNVITGPNNVGKSTIIEGLRIFASAYRYASRYKPKVLTNSYDKIVEGYNIPINSLNVKIEYVHSDYNDKVTSLEFNFEKNKSLIIEFSREKEPILYINYEQSIKTAKKFREEFPINIQIIPTLGPLEEDEEIHDINYVKYWSSSKRAPRLFRNIWYYNSGEFDLFKRTINETWNGVILQAPEKENYLSNTIHMFYTEDRIDREVNFAGNGFQIWLQLLTHIIKNKDADLLVIDEPEIYLHPDLQRKLIYILRKLNSKVLIATHSVEIINEVDPNEILLLENNIKFLKRLTDLAGMQKIIEHLGSTQNIYLTRLARGKKLLFVEGQDIKLLQKFGKVLNLEEVFTGGSLTVIPLGGFSQWEKISHAEWMFSTIINEDVKIMALFDRDYRDDNTIMEFEESLSSKITMVHVLRRKEIENYLLEPIVLKKTINQQLKKRNLGEIEDKELLHILIKLTDLYKNYVVSHITAECAKRETQKGKDLSTIIQNKINEFEIEWDNLDYRLGVVSGKNFLSKLNGYLQERFKISITTNQIVNNMEPKYFGEDIRVFIKSLEELVNVV
ncbi:ATP-dependent nuclease [Psychrobacillus psychrodurans]|uniref:ATP-binding protein n=1 Tax=Psychrobacillus psychrodurans TaxID=126157 RepID=A0A9X3L8I3_9BACI|nr:ATP-binding protein [Psychrobacillus psychrodurans]MCZ8533362.1 ATP-binding protein [Psychrobacillus psychrodurans]